jgi:histone acetyltransferase MYST1
VFELLGYLLTRMEGTCGSPEKPLSDLGKLSYRSYWSYTLLTILKEDASTLTIDDLSKMTGFTKIDIVETLNSLGLIKYWRGENILCVTPKQVEEKLRSIEPKRRPQIELDSSCLVWEPPNSTCDVAPSTSAAAATSSKGGAGRGAGKY